LNYLHTSNPKAYWELFKKLKCDDQTNNADKIGPDRWLNHFESLSKADYFKTPSGLDSTLTELSQLESCDNFTELDYRITKGEIQKALKELKNGKASGHDGICNEMLKHSSQAMLDPLEKMFNLVLSSGVYPDSWAIGFIKPIHKKADPLVPDNYRGITITSVMGKLFNAIINYRVVDFLDKHNILRPEQIGFRAKYRTSDHIFVIKALADKYKSNKKALYTCFVDFQKAFDSVSHPCLFYKLLKLNMNGRVYRVIKSMYSKVSLQVNTGRGLTKTFTSDVGVRQGDNLSPTLFNIFVNDIPGVFDNTCDPVSLASRPLNCLLYADDLVLLSESANGMQNAINKLQSYCDRWGLTVNAQKTNILVINSQKKVQINPIIDGKSINCVDEVSYLGVTIDKNANFKAGLQAQYHKGLKAIFKLTKSLNPLPNIATGLHLFDHMVKPVLLYGSEVWAPILFGTRNNKIINSYNLEAIYNSQKPPIEKAHLKYNKMLLGLPRNTDNLVTYGELGVYPLYIDAIDRMLKYWHFIEFKSKNILLLDAYRCLQELQLSGKHTWLKFASSIKSIFTNHAPVTAPSLSIIHKIKSQLIDRYGDYWQKCLMSDDKTTSDQGRKLRTYRKFKTDFGQEQYLQVITNPKWRVALTRLRVSAHRLMIEQGRRTRTEVSKRLCLRCPENAVEDEEHFLMKCPSYEHQRSKLFCLLKSKSPLLHHLSSNDQFIWIMSNWDIEIILALGEYTSFRVATDQGHKNSLTFHGLFPDLSTLFPDQTKSSTVSTFGKNTSIHVLYWHNY
jgi:hypothetical protein